VQLPVKKGYTLVEVLVALLMFSVTLLGLFAAVSAVVSNSLLMLERTEAVSILTESLELARNSSDATALNSGFQSCAESLSNCALRRRIKNLNVCFGRFYRAFPVNGTSLKRVSVEVCWKNRGRLLKVLGETIVGK